MPNDTTPTPIKADALRNITTLAALLALVRDDQEASK